MIPYNVNSPKAEEFINHQEILDTLEYAKQNKSNRALIEGLIERAHDCKGLNHREAAVLLECEEPDLIQKVKELAMGDQAALLRQPHCDVCAALSLQLLRQRLHLLSLSLQKQAHLPQKADPGGYPARSYRASGLGHKRLALEAGEDPINNPIEYILESIQTIYSIKHKNGAIRRVNVNIAGHHGGELPAS